MIGVILKQVKARDVWLGAFSKHRREYFGSHLKTKFKEQYMHLKHVLY